MTTPVVQFGTSRFLQAHVDLMIHEATEAGAPSSSVTIVASSGGAAGKARLAGFADPSGYPVLIRGLANGRILERDVRVRSVRRGLDVQADWPEVVRTVIEEASFIVSNTTESGFAVPDDLQLDLGTQVSLPPPGYPAKLLTLLALRHAAGAAPLAILPTELISHNGDTLQAIVLDLARRNRASDALVRFIEECVFANALVDRIVSGALEPAGAIAEPYALWALQSRSDLQLPCEHPAISIVADLEPVERLKLHILNLGHTVMAETWLTTGLDETLTVRAFLADRSQRRLVTSLYEDEVIPGFAACGMRQEAPAYLATTMERFQNPFLDHRISDIANGHSQKVNRRIGGFLRWIDEAGAVPAPRLRLILNRSVGLIAD